MPSSGYVADTFIAGEQPTTAKWNELWGNDASFNNGNGFNDGIIAARHIATGIQLPDKIFNPYKFSVYPNATLSGNGIITFDTKNYDTGNNFNTTTHLFTAPVAGFYQFNAYVTYNINAITGYGIYLYKNGSTQVGAVFNVAQGSFSTYGISLSKVLQLAQNDTIGLYSSGTTAAIYNNDNQTHLDGYLVSAT